MKIGLLTVLNHFSVRNTKIELLDDVSTSIVRVPVNFERCASKIVGGVEFLRRNGFFQNVILPIFAAWLSV